MEWTLAQIAQLRALWSEGHSSAEIGRRLGTSKNSIVGKSHRLDLPARPSPIIRGDDPRPPSRRTVPRAAAVTLPALVSLDRPPLIPMPRATAAITVAPVRTTGRIIDCCWPIGEPGTPEFHFCSAKSEPGKPYCTLHQRRGTIQSREGRPYVPGVPQDERT